MIKKNYVITGATALYQLGYITFNPAYKAIEIEYDTNTVNYSHKYKVSVQSKDTINLGAIKLNGEKIYCGERLYIELKKFQLENTIKTQAIKNLENSINPELVKKYYDKLKNKRKNLDKPQIEKFLEKNLMNVKEVFSNKKFSTDQILREYVMALLCRKNVPLVIIKGGSAVELYIKNKRATQDIDLHCDKHSIASLIKYLQNEKNIIYFKFPEIVKFESYLIDAIPKKIFSIKAFAKTNSDIDGFSQLKPIELTFNSTYDDVALTQFKKKFNITQKNLKAFANAYALVFTKEMLIAEKYQSIISKPENSTRTKDLIDLANLVDDKTNWDNVHDWLIIKWVNSRQAQNEKQIYTTINRNQDIPLVLIKNNFIDASDMYQTKLSYDNCIEIYKYISSIMLKKLSA